MTNELIPTGVNESNLMQVTERNKYLGDDKLYNMKTKKFRLQIRAAEVVYTEALGLHDETQMSPIGARHLEVI
jgi:hypothetical protein